MPECTLCGDCRNARYMNATWYDPPEAWCDKDAEPVWNEEEEAWECESYSRELSEEEMEDLRWYWEEMKRDE